MLLHPTAQLLNLCQCVLGSTLTLCLSNALGAGIDSPSALTINLEARIDEDVQRALEARGHILNVHDPWAAFFGGMQGICVHESGGFSAGADPRRDGYAVGF